MFSLALVCLLAGLRKNCSSNLYNIRRKDVTWAADESIRFQSESVTARCMGTCLYILSSDIFVNENKNENENYYASLTRTRTENFRRTRTK